MFTENTEELAQNKLLLLYILKTASYSFTKEELTEFILEKDYMNYFLIQQYILELLQSGFIKVDNGNEDKFILLEKGSLALDYFESKVPGTLKEELAEIFQKEEKIKKQETQVVSEYFEKENNQFNVNLKLVENNDTLFSLYLNVATLEQAEGICKIWKNEPDSIYQGIINMFIKE